ncbi:MAG: hypothetical protein COA32_12455 [Fluviicola sp.]|nr:MAG: hypothetical protein COA32_12455 [Fluviicola sp.]
MKSILAVLIGVIISTSSWSQVSGDLKKDNRQLVSDHSFVMEGTHMGKVVFDISVNAKGEVTSAKLVESESTLKSTPAKIKAKNYVLKFEFQPGTWFPKYHQGRVAITMVKPK